MCVVSNISDDWWKRQQPKFIPYEPLIPNTGSGGTAIPNQFPPLNGGPFRWVTEDDFNAFKEEMRKELFELHKLLLAAKEYDTKTGQPDCEAVDKVALFRTLGKLLDVDFSDIFPDKSTEKPEPAFGTHIREAIEVFKSHKK